MASALQVIKIHGVLPKRLRPCLPRYKKIPNNALVQSKYFGSNKVIKSIRNSHMRIKYITDEVGEKQQKQHDTLLPCKRDLDFVLAIELVVVQSVLCNRRACFV